MTTPTHGVGPDGLLSLLPEFEVTRPEDPAAAAERCREMEIWLAAAVADGSISHTDAKRTSADLHFVQGMLCHHSGDLEAAIDRLQQSIDESDQVGYPERQIHALRSISLCYENAGMQEEATASIFDAIDRARALDDNTILALVSLTLSALYQAQGAWAQLLESAHRTCEYAELTDHPPLLSRAYSAVAVALAYAGRANEGFAWLDRASSVASHTPRPLELAYLNLNRMFLLRRAGRIAECIELAENVRELLTRIPPTDSARIAVLIADIQLTSGDLDQAEQMLAFADEIAQNELLTAHVIDYHRAAAKVHEARGEPQLALDALRKHARLSQRIRGRNAEIRLVAVERHFAKNLAERTEELHYLRTVELVEKNDQLAALNHQKDEILNVVAHDLRSPLAAAQMLSESLILEAGQTSPEDTLEQLRSIQAATVEMNTTITNLLHLQHHTQPTELATVDAVLVRSLERAEHAAAQRQVTFRRDIAPVDLTVDGALLQRSLDDVFGVAIGATQPGEVISVSLSPAGEGAQIVVSCRCIAEPPDDRTLYIARRLVERMRGSITLASLDGSAGAKAVIDLRGP